MTVLSPGELMVMLHYHCSPVPYTGPATPKWADEVVHRLWQMGLLAKNGAGEWESTERGKVYVQLVCATPLPMKRWVDPRTETQ